MSTFNCAQTPQPRRMSHSTSNPALPQTPVGESNTPINGDDRDDMYILITFAVMLLSFTWMSVYFMCGRTKPLSQKNKTTPGPESGQSQPPSQKNSKAPEPDFDSEYPPGIQIDKVIDGWKKRNGAD